MGDRTGLAGLKQAWLAFAKRRVKEPTRPQRSKHGTNES